MFSGQAPNITLIIFGMTQHANQQGINYYFMEQMKKKSFHL
jgi:hypothetical protein